MRWVDRFHRSTAVMNAKTSEPLRRAVRDGQAIQRRHWVLGVGAAGAAAVAVKALPGTVPTAPPAAPVEPIVDTAGGYRLTAHVRRYYETTQA
jgi:hypothetical protein